MSTAPDSEQSVLRRFGELFLCNVPDADPHSSAVLAASLAAFPRSVLVVSMIQAPPVSEHTYQRMTFEQLLWSSGMFKHPLTAVNAASAARLKATYDSIDPSKQLLYYFVDWRAGVRVYTTPSSSSATRAARARTASTSEREAAFVWCFENANSYKKNQYPSALLVVRCESCACISACHLQLCAA